MSALAPDALLTLERSGWDSLCRSEGGTFYAELMTAEAVMILPNGMVLDRTAIAESLNDSPPWKSYDLTNVRFVPVDDCSAALVYRAVALRDGDDHPFVALMSSLYTLVNDTPRLALYQQTTITH